MSAKLKKILLTAMPVALLLLATTSSVAYAGPTTNYVNAFKVQPPKVLLDPSFNPGAAVGGVPFCRSGSLGTILCYPPNFIKEAYNFPPTTGQNGLDGKGQTIVIVDAFGSPTIQSDLNLFDTTFGLPAATVTVLCGPTWTGASTDVCPVRTIADLTTAPNANVCGAVGWAEETTLDVTMSHALAPGARIVLVVAQDCFDTNINAAELAVVSQNSLRGSIMSQSFGEPDNSIDPGIKAQADSIYALARTNVWTVLASSGDDGANENARFAGTGELTPSWPASSPLNLAIGGTQGLPYGGQYGPPPGPGGNFTCAAQTTCNTGLVLISGRSNGCKTAARPGEPSGCRPLGYGGEGTWNEFTVFGLPGTSSGGGVSSQYDRPHYQADLPSSFPTLLGSSVPASGRLTPDVSFNAAIHGGVLAYLGFLGLWAVFGGTSAGSPAWAAIIALVDQSQGGPVGFINPAIYRMAQSPQYSQIFHDITTGNNSDTAGASGLDGFTASPGYDLTTGWGTPDVAHFISDFMNNQNDQNG